DLGKVAERCALIAKPIRPLGDCYRLAREHLGLAMLTAGGVDACLHLSPQQLRRHVLLIAEPTTEPGLRLSLLVPPECAERAAKPRRKRRKVAAPAGRLEELAIATQVAHGGRVVACKSCDLSQEPVTAVGIC